MKTRGVKISIDTFEYQLIHLKCKDKEGLGVRRRINTTIKSNKQSLVHVESTLLVLLDSVSHRVALLDGDTLTPDLVNDIFCTKLNSLPALWGRFLLDHIEERRNVTSIICKRTTSSALIQTGGNAKCKIKL